MTILSFSYADDDVPIPRETAVQRAEKRQWQYATHDPNACAALAERLGQSCRLGRTITYAELARGITFRLPSINDGASYPIDIQSGNRISQRDRLILDDFLYFLSLQSFKSASILASANVIDSADKGRAPVGFLEAARMLGLKPFHGHHIAEGRLSREQELENIALWGHELRKVYAWFKENPV